MDDSSNFEFAAAEPLDDIMQKIADHKGCGTSGGSGKSSCGTSDGPDDMAPEIWEKVKNHPCYSEEAHHHYARMHVAVAPACNIQCNYCNRKYDCANESRPGVVSEKLTPEQAAKKVLAVASTIPQMTVLGVAGPGDPLANPAKTFKTFELISQTAPDIKLCLSTNGLALPDHVDTIAKYNVDHVTITVNMVDPEVGAQIYPWIFWKNKRVTGIEAARILTERQMQGLEMLTERGILCKVNSVMIPGVNDKHLVEVNRAVKSRGAFLHNIMPLISAPEHGTVFGLNGQRGPDGARTEGVAGQLRRRDEHDAALPPVSRRRGGPARGRPLARNSPRKRSWKWKFPTISNRVKPIRTRSNKSVSPRSRRRTPNLRRSRREEASDIKILVAVATKGQGRINEHFGHAKEFQVYELSSKGAKFVGHRRVDLYCQGGYGEEDSLETVIKAINDCAAVFVAKIGHCPKDELTAAGIEPIDQYAFEFIEQSAIAYFKDYLDRVKRGEIAHVARGDADIRQGAYISA